MQDMHAGVLYDFAEHQALVTDYAKYVGDIRIRKPKPAVRPDAKCHRCGATSLKYYCPTCTIIRNAMRGTGTAQREVANKRRAATRASRAKRLQ